MESEFIPVEKRVDVIEYINNILCMASSLGKDAIFEAAKALEEALYDLGKSVPKDSVDHDDDARMSGLNELCATWYYLYGGTFQVNHVMRVNGADFYTTSRYHKDGYCGVLTDTVYENGADQTDWCCFVGTYDECQEYIRNQIEDAKDDLEK